MFVVETHATWVKKFSASQCQLLALQQYIARNNQQKPTNLNTVKIQKYWQKQMRSCILYKGL